MLTNLVQRVSPKWLLLASLVLVFISYACERFLADPAFLVNPVPNFSPIHIVRTGIVALSGLLLVAYILQPRTQPLSTPKMSNHWVFKTAPWLGWVMVLSCVAVFLINPILFTSVTNEEGVIENLSALGLFASFIFMAVVFVWFAASNRQLKHKAIVFVCIIVLGLGTFVIGMEEVSWLQRFLKYETPALLSDNDQGEANLHNLASNTSEEVYYFGSFVLLILIPFIADQSNLLKRFENIRLFLPSVTVLFSCAAFAAFNYNLWNRTSIQFAFYTTLWILVFYAYHALQGKETGLVGRYFPVLLLATYIICQIIFIVRGEKFLDTWTITEYRELVMPYGFAVYTLEIAWRSRKMLQQYRTKGFSTTMEKRAV